VVNGNLLFTNGLINTSVNNTLTITNTDINCVIPSGGSNTSYVNGPLSKIINQGDDFAFPIGQGILPGNRIKVSATQTGPLLWTAQYFNPNPTSGSYAFPLSVVSWNEYWSVTPALPSQADIILTYYPNSDIIPLVTLEGLPALKVANYYAGQWNELPSIASGTNFNGTVSTTALVAIPSSPENYTMAVITSIIPKAKLSPTGAICGQTGIPVTFSAPVSIPFNYILYYTINDTPQDPVTITPTMLPYVLPTYFTGSSAVYMLTGFTYNNGADTGVADPTPVTAYANPTAANAGYSQSVCGITSVRLSGNNPAPYTGIWSIVSGTGGTVITPNNPVSQFNGILPNSYTLQWTINNGSCESTSDVAIAFTTRPSPPVALPSQNLCDGATISEINVSASTGIVSWYTSSTYPPVSTALTSSTLLTTGTIYYADAVSGTCISTSPLTPVIVTLEPPPSTTAIHHDE
jgi:hypothetical protein